MAFARAKSAKHAAGVAAALDIGGGKAACLVASTLIGPHGAADIEVIGVGQHGVSLGLSRKDYYRAHEEALRAAIDAAERMSGERIRKAVVAVGGQRLISRRIGVDLDLAGGAVAQEDIIDCLRAGVSLAARDGARPVHALPIGFSVDGEAVGANPSGLVGAALTAEMLGLAIRETHEANIRALVDSCDIVVEEIVAGPLAASEAVLVEDEKELGALMIDIGARSADFLVYEDGVPVACGGVGLGGEHITRDIAQIYGCTLAHAERMKTLHGSALSGPGDDHRFVEFPQLCETADVVKAPRSELAAVISSRVEEIFGLVKDEADKAVGRGRKQRARSGFRRVVLTGGASLLTGARETAESIFGVKARQGRPIAISGAPDVATAPQYAVAMGALLGALEKKPDWRRPTTVHPRLNETFGRHAEAGGVVQGTLQWLKANF